MKSTRDAVLAYLEAWTVPRAIAARRTHRSTACLRARYCTGVPMQALRRIPVWFAYRI